MSEMISRLIRAYEAAQKTVGVRDAELTASETEVNILRSERDALRQQLATAQARVAELDELKTTLTNATTLLQRICAARDSDVPATDEEWYTLCDDCDLFLTGLAGVLCPNCQTVGDHSTGDGGWSCETPSYHTIASLQIEVRRLRDQLAARDKQIAELQRVAGRLDNALERSGEQLAAGAAEIVALQHDITAYRGALGYALPGDHDGRLSDGTTPHNALCDAVQRIVAQCDAEIARLTAVIAAREAEIVTLYDRLAGLQREAAVAARDGSGVE